MVSPSHFIDTPRTEISAIKNQLNMLMSPESSEKKGAIPSEFVSLFEDVLSRLNSIEDRMEDVQVFLQALITHADTLEPNLHSDSTFNQYQELGPYLLESMSDAVIILDSEFNIEFVSKSAEKFYHWSSEAIAKTSAFDNFLAHYSKAKLGGILKHLEQKKSWVMEQTHHRNNHPSISVKTHWFYVTNSSSKQRIVILVEDNCEVKSIESQFIKSQRMASLGLLTSGVAHDLNNVLVPIFIGIETLKSRIDQKDSEGNLVISLLESSSKRAEMLVRQLLAFASGSDFEMNAVNFSDILGELKMIVSKTFTKEFVLKTRVPKALKPMKGDATQLFQVLLNIALNARDAMPEGGVFNISAKNVLLSAKAALKKNMLPGQYVEILMADNGIGMSQDTLDQIFEPFYTTKNKDKGTGLGLNAVFSIIKRHNGFIDVDSHEGKGTKFRMLIPANKD